jgi:hypothetical protein
LPLAPEQALRIVEENLNLQAGYRTVLGGLIRGAGSQEGADRLSPISSTTTPPSATILY